MSIDGTSRVQTVSKKDNPNFYKLLKNFHVPFVLNTSLNLSGHTLVEDLEDLKYMMDYGNLKYSYLPEKEILIIR
jgi:carbamoyltransferase